MLSLALVSRLAFAFRLQERDVLRHFDGKVIFCGAKSRRLERSDRMLTPEMDEGRRGWSGTRVAGHAALLGSGRSARPTARKSCARFASSVKGRILYRDRSGMLRSLAIAFCIRQGDSQHALPTGVVETRCAAQACSLSSSGTWRPRWFAHMGRRPRHAAVLGSLSPCRAPSGSAASDICGEALGRVNSKPGHYRSKVWK